MIMSTPNFHQKELKMMKMGNVLWQLPSSLATLALALSEEHNKAQPCIECAKTILRDFSEKDWSLEDEVLFFCKNKVTKMTWLVKVI